VPPERLEALPAELLAGLKEAVGERISVRHRRSRAGAAIAVLAATLALGGIGATIAASAGAHTGLFGPQDDTSRPGFTSLMDSSELLDQSAPDILTVIDGFAARYPLPPGGTWDRFKEPYPRRERGYVQTAGLEARVALESTCQWQDSWLTAARTNEAQSMTKAQGVLDAVPMWPIVHRTVDALGVTGLRALASAARTHDVAEFAKLHDRHCNGPHSPW
jgi:hypothetical protein